MAPTHLIGHSAAAVLAVVIVGASAGTAHARGGDDTTRVAGTCSGSSVSELKAKSDDGRLEVELEVDSSRVGQTWSVRLADNGTHFFTGTRRTTAPSGSFSVERLTADRAGADRLTAVATNSVTGERCSAVLTRP